MITKLKLLPQKSCIYQHRISQILIHTHPEARACGRYLLEQGLYFTEKDTCDDLIIGKSFQKQLCYSNAVKLALKHDLKVVDGFCNFSDSPRVILSHTFAIDDQGRVHDPARTYLRDKPVEYFGLLLPINNVVECYPIYGINAYLQDELNLNHKVHIK